MVAMAQPSQGSFANTASRLINMRSLSLCTIGTYALILINQSYGQFRNWRARRAIHTKFPKRAKKRNEDRLNSNVVMIVLLFDQVMFLLDMPECWTDLSTFVLLWVRRYGPFSDPV